MRETGPDMDATLSEFGGGYVWDELDKECLPSVEFVLNTIPPDNCAEVARSEDNPNVDPDARPAQRLRKIIARSDGC